MPSPPCRQWHSPGGRLLLLCLVLLTWVHSALCEPALRGSIQQELDKDQQEQLEREGDKTAAEVWGEDKAAAEVLEPGTTTATDGNATNRELQQTSVQSFTSSYQQGTTFNDTGATGITGIGQQPQITTNPEGAGSIIVFGGGAQQGVPGIAGGGTVPTLGGPSGLGLSGVGFRRSMLDMEEAAEDVQALEEVGATVDLQPDSSMDTTANSTERELQQTSVQAFINSYQGPGNRFNDTGPTGITGPVPRGGHAGPQVAHSPVVSGVGVLFGGGAQAGAPGIAGGTFPTLAGQPGVGAGGAGIGASSTGLGTTAGAIGGAPGGAGFIGPSGLPAPISAPGGIGSVGGIGGAGGSAGGI